MVVNSTVGKFCSAVSAEQGNEKSLSQLLTALQSELALVSSVQLCVIKSSCFARKLLIVVKCGFQITACLTEKFHLLNFFFNCLFFKFACIGQRETAPACTRGGLDQIVGEISSTKGLSNSGTGWPGKRWGHHI